MQDYHEKNLNRYGLPGFYILLISLFCFFAICGYGRTTNMIASVLLCVLSVIFLYASKGKINKDNWGKSYICFILYFLFLLITSLPNMTSGYYFFGTTVLWTLVQFFPMAIFSYIRKVYDYKKLRFLFVILTIVWFLIILVSIVAFAAADIGGRSFAQLSRGFLIGGGYPMAYGSTILVAVAVFMILDKQRKSVFEKVFYTAVLVISVIHVLLTQSVITIAAMCAGIALGFIFHGRKGSLHSKLGFIVIVGVIILVLLNTKQIGLELIQIGGKIQNQIFSQRIIEMGQWMFSDTESYHVGARTDTIFASLKTFLTNPLLGVGYKVGNEYSYFADVGIGNHSEILDIFAQCGFIGGLLFMGIYYYQIKAIIGMTSLNISIPLITALLILGLFNPFVSAQTGFMLFLYLPLLIKLHEEKMENELSLSE